MNSHILSLALAVLMAPPAEEAKPVQAAPYPVLQIALTYPGAAPQVVDDTVCAPAEAQIAGMDGLRSITCISYKGRAEIYVQGIANANVATLTKRVEKRLELALPVLPAAAKIDKVKNFSGQPIPSPAKAREIERPFVDLDPTKARLLGVSLKTAFDAIKKAMKEGKPLTDVTVESGNGAKVLLSEFATIKNVRMPDHLVRRWPARNEDATPSKGTDEPNR